MSARRERVRTQGLGPLSTPPSSSRAPPPPPPLSLPLHPSTATTSYYRDAHGLIFVVDAADPARWEEARAALEGAVSHPDLAGAPLLVVAHKADAVGGTAATAADDVATALGPAAADGPPSGPGGLVVAGAARPVGGGAALGHALAWLVARGRRGRRADALRARPAPT